MRQIITKTLFCFLLISVSCKRDHLYYTTNESAIVRCNVEWLSAALKPNGLSAYVYNRGNSSNTLVGNHISSNPNKIEVSLPSGEYDLMILNDTEYELDNIYFEDVDNLETFKILTKSSSKPIYRNLSMTDGVQYSTETDVVARKIIPKIKVESDDIEYFLERPTAESNKVFMTLDIVPEQISESIDIEIYVRNIISSAGAPRSHITNMSAGYWLGLDKKHEQLLTHEFVLNNREMISSDSKDGKISKKIVSFGPLRNKTKLINQHNLIMHFMLINGENHIVDLNVTNIIDSSYDGVKNVHKIRAEIKLPIVIGGDGGAFNPDIEDWEDVEIELPI